MNIIILAAGRGSRMKGLTKNIPKCLLPIDKLTIIEHQLRIIRSLTDCRIIVVTGYQGNKLKKLDARLLDNENFANSNMLVSLLVAKEFLNEEVIISYSDILYDRIVLEKLILSRHAISVVIDKQWKNLYSQRFTDPLTDAESLVMNKKKQIINIGERGVSEVLIQGQFIGLIKLSKKSSVLVKKELENLSRNYFNTEIIRKRSFKNAFMTDFLQWLINKKKIIHAVEILNGWYEFDSVKDYKTFLNWFHQKLLVNKINLKL